MNIFTLSGEILLRDNGVEGQIDRIDSRAQGAHKSFGSMIGTAAKWGAALAVAVGGIAVASIKDAAEAEASLAQLDAVLKSTGGAAGVTRTELTDLADSLEKTTKFSAESTQEAQALLLTFTNIGKDVFPEATRTALDMATALGGDAASQSIALGKALNDPTKGITALTRVGVTFTDEQKNVIKKLQETGDMAGAQKVILAELSKEFGGSAEAAGKTFAGQLEIAKNALGNVTETIGTALLPKLTEFLNWVTPHLPAIADFFTNSFDRAGTAIKNVGTAITETTGFISRYWDIFAPILAGTAAGAIAFGIITNAIKAYRTMVIITTAVQGFFNISLGASALLMGGVVIGIGLLVAAGVALYMNWDTVKGKAGELWHYLKESFTSGVNACIGVVNNLIRALNNIPGVNAPLISTIRVNQEGTTQFSGGRNVGTNAAGTDNWRGGLTWVGEEGPELLNLPKGSQITSNKKSMGMGQTLNFNGTVYMRDPNETRQTLQQLQFSSAM